MRCDDEEMNLLLLFCCGDRVVAWKRLNGTGRYVVYDWYAFLVERKAFGEIFVLLFILLCYMKLSDFVKNTLLVINSIAFHT